MNLTQQKHTFTNQKKCTTTPNKHKKLKPGLVASYNIWPGNGEGLFWFRHFINLSLTYLDTFPLTYIPGTHKERLAHQSLSGQAPAYLASDNDLVSESGCHLLLSASDGICIIPCTHGKRTSRAADPRGRNDLPSSITSYRQFKWQMKTCPSGHQLTD